MTQAPILIGDFQHPVMTWARILDDETHTEHPKATCPQTEKQAYDAQVLDLRIWHSSGEIFEDTDVYQELDEDDIPDPRVPGMYNFFFADEWGRQGQCPNRFHGIVVTPDGTYEPNMTAHAIYVALTSWVGSETFDETYIDRIYWCEISNCFGVMVDT